MKTFLLFAFLALPMMAHASTAPDVCTGQGYTVQIYNNAALILGANVRLDRVPESRTPEDRGSWPVFESADRSLGLTYFDAVNPNFAGPAGTHFQARLSLANGRSIDLICQNPAN